MKAQRKKPNATGRAWAVWLSVRDWDLWDATHPPMLDGGPPEATDDPAEVLEWEAREPSVRFLTPEQMDQFLALEGAGASRAEALRTLIPDEAGRAAYLRGLPAKRRGRYPAIDWNRWKDAHPSVDGERPPPSTDDPAAVEHWESREPHIRYLTTEQMRQYTWFRKARRSHAEALRLIFRR